MQYRGRLPFTDAQVEAIAQRSAGVPHVIDMMANELLADLESGNVRNSVGGFPVRHAVLAVTLVVLVGLVYLLLQPGDVETAEAGDIALVEQPLSPADVASNAEIIDQMGRAADQPIPPDIGAAEIEVVDQASVAEAQPSEEVVQPTEGSPQSAGDGEAGGGVVVEAPPMELEPLQEELEEAAPQEEELEESAALEAAPQSETEAPRPISPAPDPVIPVVEPTGVNTGSWLLSKRSDYFTLQLLTLSRRQGGLAFIQRQSEPGEFAMFQTSREGQTYHVVTYGLFSSRQAAQAALRQSSAEIQALKPWIRQLSGIQESIKSTPQS